MILSLVVILFVGLIAYLHYVQGLLTGIISAVLAVIAAMMAISYHEALADTMVGGKMSDMANGVALLAIFAGVYIVGRTLFDKLIPGNVRLPHLLDSIGGAACGVVAGVMGTGIVAIALQSMPFGPAVAGYARYELKGEPREVTIPGPYNRQVNRQVYNELSADDLEQNRQAMWLPADDIVLGLASRLSNGGALSGARPIETVHPDLLQEYFGQRLGSETGAKRTANAKKSAQVEVRQVNVLNPQSIEKEASEYNGIRPQPPRGEALTPKGSKQLVSVTLTFKPDAADSDRLVRLGPGAVRIVTPGTTPEGEEGFKNNFPIATVQEGKAWMAKPDDFLFIDTGKGGGVNFLFELDGNALSAAPDAKMTAGKNGVPDKYQFADGSFLEVKRLVKVPLAGKEVALGMPPEDPKFYPLRKHTLREKADTSAADTEEERRRRFGGPGGGPGSSAAPKPGGPFAPTDQNGWKGSPLSNPVMTAGNKLPHPIGVGTSDADADVATKAVSAHLTGKKFDVLDVDPATREATISELGAVAPTVQDLFVPPGKRMVQVKFTVTGDDPYTWMNPLQQKLTVVDARTNAGVGPQGFYARVNDTGFDKLYVRYRTKTPATEFAKVRGKVQEVTLIYLVDESFKANELRYQGKPGGVPLEP